MKFSMNGEDLLIELEGVKLYPYDDRTGKRVSSWNRWTTIGVGYLMPEKEFKVYSQGISMDTAIELMHRTLVPFEECINTLVKGTLTQPQYDALVCFVYNIGISRFTTSSALKLLNGLPGSNYPTLEQAWLAYKKDEGKDSIGLYNRRIREWRVFSTGKY